MNRIYHMLMAVALFLCVACGQSRDTVAVRDSGTTFAQEALQQYVGSREQSAYYIITVSRKPAASAMQTRGRNAPSPWMTRSCNAPRPRASAA